MADKEHCLLKLNRILPKPGKIFTGNVGCRKGRGELHLDDMPSAKKERRKMKMTLWPIKYHQVRNLFGICTELAGGLII